MRISSRLQLTELGCMVIKGVVSIKNTINMVVLLQLRVRFCTERNKLPLKKHDNKQTAIRKYWTRHGSTKYIWTKQSLALAISYVKNEQGRAMEFGSSERNRAPNVSE